MSAKITTNQHDFLTAVAAYINDNCNGYDWEFDSLVALHRMIEVYHEASPAFISYVVQFNYEDEIGHVDELYKRIVDTFARVYNKEVVY